TRTPHDLLPEHHTSEDNLSLLTPSALADTIGALAAIIDVIDRDRRFVNLLPKGEPRLGDRGLYATLSGGVPGGAQALGKAMLWVLNLSDGKHSLLEIAERSQIPFALLAAAAETLVSHDVVAELDQGETA
ncbi:MAG: peptidase M28, partial [Thermoplasmata archaeon]|nr:peptidase M28 [Thermoplasmata archaeon]